MEVDLRRRWICSSCVFAAVDLQRCNSIYSVGVFAAMSSGGVLGAEGYCGALAAARLFQAAVYRFSGCNLEGVSE